MATTADGFGILGERLRKAPVTEIIDPHQDSDQDYLAEEPMPPPRRHVGSDDAEFDLRETLHVLALSSTATLKLLESQTATHAAQVSALTANGHGEKRRMNWFMASIAIITLLGAGGNFVGSSGIWVGEKSKEQTYLIERVKAAESKSAEIQLKLDKLRDLYMIRFSEDPDKVDTDTMRRKKENR